MKFKKPLFSIEEQLILFKQRGLLIKDEVQAKNYLKHINYYHFSVYTKHFQNSLDEFQSNISFSDIVRIYEFDKKLRLGILDILERIEISFKSVLIDKIGKATNDIFWYTKEEFFDVQKKDAEGIFNKSLGKVKTSKESYIQHFYKKYQDPYPPVWMCFESFSFGETTKFANILDPKWKQLISGEYKLPKATSIHWLKNLAFLRNICAHHSILWNRQFPREMKKTSPYDALFYKNETKTLYAYLVIMQIFLSKINPTSSWIDRLDKLIIEYNMPISSMGFPENWKQKLSSI